MEKLLDAKREKFRKDLQKSERDVLLKMNRISGDFGDHPLLILPGLIEKQDHNTIQQILDEITFSDKSITEHMDFSYIQTAYHNSAKTTLNNVLFKLINRLGIWQQSWLEEAAAKWEKDNTMLKQIAFYLSSKNDQNSKYSQILLQIAIQKVKLRQPEDLLYYLEIFSHLTSKFQQQHRHLILPFVDECLNSDNYSCQIMVLQILLKYDFNLNECNAIIKMENFKKISEWAINDDYSRSSTSFQIIINLLVGDDNLIDLLFSSHNLSKILNKFLQHIFPAQRILAYWGFANLSASYNFMKQCITLIPILLHNYPMEQFREKLEILFGFVNILYLADNQQLEEVRLKQQKLLQIVLDALDSDQLDLITKCLQAIYSAICKSEELERNLEQYGLLTKVGELEKHPNKQISGLCSSLLEKPEQN